MNAKEMIFALALASNDQPRQYFSDAYFTICTWGEAKFSPIYEIPCRDAVGADYWNGACLLKTTIPKVELEQLLKHLECASGRRRPSHQITLDIDLIAWGANLAHMQFNQRKMPLALDVKIPLYELWPCSDLYVAKNCFRQVAFTI